MRGGKQERKVKKSDRGGGRKEKSKGKIKKRRKTKTKQQKRAFKKTSIDKEPGGKI